MATHFPIYGEDEQNGTGAPPSPLPEGRGDSRIVFRDKARRTSGPVPPIGKGSTSVVEVWRRTPGPGPRNGENRGKKRTPALGRSMANAWFHPGPVCGIKELVSPTASVILLGIPLLYEQNSRWG